MYRLVKPMGDTIEVPQLLFSKLAAPGSDEGRFRVALYLLAQNEGDAPSIAAALKLPKGKVEAALSYWEGAGLLAQDSAPTEAPAPLKRRKMTTREVVRAGEADPTLGLLLEELQRLFGTVIGENDVNVYVSLYVQEGFTAELILLAATEALAHGSTRARYVDKILATWRQQGINDSAAADAYLKLQAERAKREQQLAKRLGYQGEDPFSYADKKKIVQWFEDFGFAFDMVDLARMAAGDKAGDIKYMHSILKKWHGKGYRVARDVQQSGEDANLRTLREAPSPTQTDMLMDAAQYVPLKKRGGT